jgi:bifunctional DNA-binding transcriptional regulator/antitoxin component of YhaV-PrlF toxin-antitoxin module
MKATGIVRRIDDLGRVVIPKEIRRTMRIKEGEPSLATLTEFDRFYIALHSVAERIKAE